MLPVLSLLLIGAGLLGQVTLQEFALALFVGMFTGAYSSLFVAAPLLGWFKSRSPQFARRHADPTPTWWVTTLRAVVVSGSASVRPPTGRRRPRRRRGRRPADGERRRVRDRVERPGAQPPAPAAQEEAALARPTSRRAHRRVAC